MHVCAGAEGESHGIGGGGCVDGAAGPDVAGVADGADDEHTVLDAGSGEEGEGIVDGGGVGGFGVVGAEAGAEGHVWGSVSVLGVREMVKWRVLEAVEGLEANRGDAMYVLFPFFDVYRINIELSCMPSPKPNPTHEYAGEVM